MTPIEQVLASAHQALLDAATLIEAANLSKAKLRNASLVGADFSGVNLKHADLSGSDLRNAKMKECNLTGANFAGSNLSGALLRKSNARGADFRKAMLKGTDFRGCALEGARFAGAKYDSTTKWPGGQAPKASGSMGRPTQKANQQPAKAKPGKKTGPTKKAAPTKAKKKPPSGGMSKMSKDLTSALRNMGYGALDADLMVQEVEPLIQAGRDLQTLIREALRAIR